MKKIFLIIVLVVLACPIWAQDPQLTGTIIASQSHDYGSGEQLASYAFDDDIDTYYASSGRYYTYVGYDLGTPHVITKVGWTPRNDNNVGSGRVKLAVFEGANRADFMDAVPIYLVDEAGTYGQMSTADVDCSRGFRYVRYVGPSDARCNVAEVRFYGHPGAGDDTHLYRPTNLPAVFIHTTNDQDPYDKVNEIFSYVSFVDENDHITTDTALVRLRGNASMGFPKKPYNVKFFKKKQPLDAPSKNKTWCLINNYGDKTLMRNLVAFEYSRLMGMTYTPYCRPVDVFVNGEYKGCYQLADKVQVNKGRVEMEEMGPEDVSGINLTGGYFIELDGYANQEISYFNSARGIGVTIHTPDEDEIVEAQKNYIQQAYNTMENEVYNQANWGRYLDSISFYKYFLVEEMAANTDAFWSCYMSKLRGDEKLYTGPVWDFDIAFDNDSRHQNINSKSVYMYQDAGTYSWFVSKIVRPYNGGRQGIKDLWSCLRIVKGIDADTICAFIDSLETELTASARLNFMRWNILNQNVHMNWRHAGTYHGEVTWLKEFVTGRFTWLDNKIGINQNITENIIDALPDVVADGRYRVWNLQGFMIAESDEMPALPHGLYIVSHNGTTEKIHIQ